MNTISDAITQLQKENKFFTECKQGLYVAEIAANDLAIIALHSQEEREKNIPLTREEFEYECALCTKNEKERWLWGVENGEGAWYKVSQLCRWANIVNYGKTWHVCRYENLI